MKIKNINQFKFTKRSCVACLFGVIMISSMPFATSAAFAQSSYSRAIPADGYWGVAKFEQVGKVTIEGQEFTYAPAVFIRDERNLLITPLAAAARGQGVWVKFGINAMGQVDRIWLLTEQETLQAGAQP